MYENYKKENIEINIPENDIATIKLKMANYITNVIKEQEMDYSSVATKLGIADEEFLNMLSNPGQFCGTELFNVGNNLKRLKVNSSEKKNR